MTVKKANLKPSTRWDKEMNSKLNATSYDILIGWLGEEGNWAKYKGEAGTGVTKAVLHGQLVALLNKEGIFSKTAIDVANKIGSLEKAYKDACDWIANTGQGVKEDSGWFLTKF